MRIAESESVESGAKDDDLPNSSFDSFCQSIFRNPASRSGDQTSDAGQGVSVHKLKHFLFVFTQNLHGKWVIEDCAMIEHLMSSSLSGDHQGCAAGFIGIHVRGLRSHQWLIARVVVWRAAAPHFRCIASGSGYKFEQGRGFLLGNSEEAERSTLRPVYPLLSAFDARHASAEVTRKIGLAQAKGRANLANLFWSQGGHIW
jgi:hypothetical protein